MNDSTLTSALASSIRTALDRREGGSDITLTDDDLKLERPKNRDHGDWASNVAMRFAKRVGTNPRELAQEIAAGLEADPSVKKVDVAGPGFINITLDEASAGELAREIVSAGESYGNVTALAGRKINLEFVSANPTGPIHLGGARWAAVGDSLARVLLNAGANVTREYYFNDHGAQIDRFANSLVAAYLGEPTPEDGYAGQYISDIATEVAEAHPEELAAASDRDAKQEVFREHGVELMFGAIRDKLEEFRVHFDVFFHEDTVHSDGSVELAIQRLRDLGRIYEQDGAVWLRTTDFGDDKDRVIIRSNGEPTYFAGDIGYYVNKRERGFDENLYMLGADHHGYIGRMMAMAESFGDTPGVNMQILIGQMVNLVKDGEPVRMSKRAGNIVTLDDLIDAVGVDAARYSLVRSSTNTSIDIDLDLLVSRSNDNPVYYVQYAHARTRAVNRNATAAEINGDNFDPATLTHPTENNLLGQLREFPRILEVAAVEREPHRVTRYLEDLAAAYNRWYDQCRVIPQGDDPVEAVHSSRFVLNEATSQVLRNGLNMVGVEAPDRM
ncbi:arginine--tRNA ligase [Gulosibacter molinativorax]|uniref:Arginine--tRNA ligase n=1 Tax=Gulosibacter molinativorax TaxID=256821 RepID=A0ABT7C3T1_9MICO|nr:arginine--tRNA ligase [Gulosibacter molinativorax]MDJ1369890.1 arginine--tRNA ligase [Gulosibacter molinativorax]